jgi:hypothetical protein
MKVRFMDLSGSSDKAGLTEVGKVVGLAEVGVEVVGLAEVGVEVVGLAEVGVEVVGLADMSVGASRLEEEIEIGAKRF